MAPQSVQRLRALLVSKGQGLFSPLPRMPYGTRPGQECALRGGLPRASGKQHQHRCFGKWAEDEDGTVYQPTLTSPAAVEGL